MPQDAKPQGETLPEEIRELERLLEEKKRALVERGEEREHKEVFREAFREKYGELFKPPQLKPPQPLPPPPSAVISPPRRPSEEEALRVEEREEQLRVLIELSFSEGVASAVKRARRLTPWLLDELHDRLIDEYYQKLVQAGQVTEFS